MSAAPAIEGQFRIVDFSASDAFLRYSRAEALRGKGLAETMKKAMRFWVDFATAKIPAGNADKITADLKKVVASYTRMSSRRGKAADAWRGTYAARIVSMIDWQGARNLRGAAFYAKVRQFAARRRFAANFHRSGMRPAFLALRGKIAKFGKLPQFQNQPGQYKDAVSESVVDILVENWAKAGGPRSSGITGTINGKNTGRAFEDSLVQVEALFENFMMQDVRRAAERSGLTVVS